jgi:hypothetical protein
VSDPLRIGAYLGLLMVCLISAQRADSSRQRWLLALALTTLVLATALAVGAAGRTADLGRAAARTEGWYSDRRTVQAYGVLTLAAGIVCTVAWVWLGRTVTETGSRLLATLVLSLLGFLAARTVSLHQVDALLFPSVGFGVRRGDLVEIALVGAIGIACVFWSRPEDAESSTAETDGRRGFRIDLTPTSSLETSGRAPGRRDKLR